MKDHRTSCTEIIHKDVVVIGNGPSGISVSMMLSGYTPYLTSTEHPDEMLSARLQSVNPDCSLAEQSLEHLANGLEGRSTNPVSLLLDALEHPFADLGLEIPSLVQWQHHQEREIDHVVIGKGPPGGSWHTMDPNILTLSLGSWMSLPGHPYLSECTDSQRRASAGSVAQYYQQYVKDMNLEKYFHNGVIVTHIEPIQKVDSRVVMCSDNQVKVEVIHGFCRKKEDIESSRRKCSIITAINFIRSRTKCHKKTKETCVSRCKRPRDNKHDVRDLHPKIIDNEFLEEQNLRLTEDTATSLTCNHYLTKLRDNKYDLRMNDTLSNTYLKKNILDKEQNHVKPEINILTCNDYLAKPKTNCDLKKQKIRSFSFSDERDYSLNDPTIAKHTSLTNIPNYEMDCECHIPDRWLIHAYDTSNNKTLAYSCQNLVLANGSSDLPNRLGLSAEMYNLPWVLHDLRCLERQLDEIPEDVKKYPVLVVGAGLSAADAVIATRFRAIPVLHVFRNRAVSLDKQLPENMYPEYHKVHQMMLDGGSTYPLYTALPEYEVTDISTNRIVTLTSKTGVTRQYKVSYVVILIGSRPNLTFLPSNIQLGVNHVGAIDSKANPVNIDKLSHCVCNYDGLYALGPLAGDNFVRFIPGGALAILSHLYKKRNW